MPTPPAHHAPNHERGSTPTAAPGGQPAGAESPSNVSNVIRQIMQIQLDKPAVVITGNEVNNGVGLSASNSECRGVRDSQRQIDAGQNQCRECGMLYLAGKAEDEMHHKVFHKTLFELRHEGWQNEKVVAKFKMDYIIEVSSDSPCTWQQKTLNVMGVVEKHLGIMHKTPTAITNQKVYMYIADKCVVGCMVTVPVSQAYRMTSSESDVDMCKLYPVKCGISRMWTLFSYRRRGVASKMLDTVRWNFLDGNLLSKDDVAFTYPTPDGMKFIIKYMDSPNFFVYIGL